MKKDKAFIIKDGVLLKYSGNDEHIVIPDGVTVVGENVFSWCPSIKSVVIPEGVVTIAARAFSWCCCLERVTLPESLREIGLLAFACCGELKYINVPSSLEKVKWSSFRSCIKLEGRERFDKFIEPPKTDSDDSEGDYCIRGPIGIKGAPSENETQTKSACPIPETVEFPPLPNIGASPSYAPPHPLPKARKVLFGGLFGKRRKENKNITKPQITDAPAMPSFSVPSAINAAIPASEAGMHCHECGSKLKEGAMYCFTCGTKVEQSTPEKLGVSRVNFSAVVPKKIIKGEYATVDISVYEKEFRDVVESIIENSDRQMREIVASPKEVSKNTEIRIKLTSPDIELEDCEEAQTWIGEYLTYTFPIMIPREFDKKQIMFTASVFFDDVIATRLKFIIDCTSIKEQKLEMLREDVLSAFISYASEDRRRVATIIQGMKKVRPEMDIFFDVENLRSGDNWEDTLRGEIEKRDILYLCWSEYAKESEWVDKEWRYALANNGMDSIEPIPLVSPAECPPPDELKSKHFNDRVLFYK